VAADGTQIWRSFDFAEIKGLAIHPVDGSCWFTTVEDEVVRLSASGSVLWSSDSVTSFPEGVSVDPSDGSCWVAGWSLVHLAADGTELLAVGVELAAALSVDPVDGSVWVGDASNARIAHYGQGGTELLDLGAFASPVSAAVDPVDGSCWVADSVRGEVVHLGRDGEELWRGGGFDHPSGVTVNTGDGSCWVAQYGHEGPAGGVVNSAIVHLSRDGTELWRGAGFQGPRSVSVNASDGSCWVADTEDDQVVHLATDGTELWRGGTFDEPWSISASSTDGSCWVADHRNEQVVHLSESGAELARIAGFNSPRSVSVNADDGSCWAAPGDDGSVVHLDGSGAELWRGGGVVFPQSVATDSRDGSCWVTDLFDYENDVGLLVHLDGAGRISQVGGYFMQSFVATGVAEDMVWVADNGNAQLVRLRTWFDDVPKSHWAFEHILGCVEGDIVGGYPDDTYRPTVTVTRGQMAVFIARAIAGGDDHVPESTGDATFPDVPEDFWALDYVEYAVDQGVVGGYEDGTYHPEYHVTRDQMAVYVARALVAPTGEEAVPDPGCTEPPFPDVPCDFWARKHIQYCVAEGVVQGYPDGKYYPYNAVTRDQMAVYVARAFDLPY
jgi:DNA-binding beta-propeller fold protein YncE